MAINVELFDGTVLEFPEGTDPSVIDRVAKQETLTRNQSAAAPTPEEQSMFRQVADVPVGIARGAVSGVRMIADAFGADNPLSQTLRGGEEYLGSLLSAQAKNNQQEIARIMKDAEDKGVTDQVLDAFKAFLVAPVDLISQALGTAAPNLVGGLAANLVKFGAKGVGAMVAGTGATMGAGIIKGEIYSAVKEELEQSGMSPEQAEAAAQEAQSYGGENLDQIALGAIIGAVASRTGIEPRLVQNLTGKVSQGLAKRGIGKFTQTVVGEAGTEALQGGQEQLAQNIALQRQGFDVPTFRGVAGQSTLEAVTGGGLGAGVSMVAGSGRGSDAPTTVTPTRTEAKLQSMREEQQTADVMRAKDEAQAQVTGQIADQEGQFRLNLPRTPRATPPRTSVQGVPLPESERGFDTFGRPLTPEAEAATATDAEPTSITQAFDESLPLEELQAERGRLEAQIPDIEDASVRKQARDRIKEIKGIESTRLGAIREQETRAKRLRVDEAGQAQLDFATPKVTSVPESQIAAEPPTSVTQETFDQLGISKSAVIRKNNDLLNADLTDPVQARFVRTALEAYRDAPKRPEAIQEKINTFLGQLPATRPVIDKQALDTLKLPKTSMLRKQLLGRDMNDPVQNQEVNKALRAALRNPNMPADTKAAIRDVIGQSEFTRQGEMFGPLGGALQSTTPRAGATDATPEPAGEPSTERPASEPSVGVASVGDGSTPAQEGATGAVPAPEVGGLADTTRGTAPDAARGTPEPASDTVTEPPAPTPAPTPTATPARDIEYTIDTAVDEASELAAQDTPDLKAVARLARNAFNSGLLPESQYKSITQSIAAREDSVGVDLYDSLILEQGGNNIANAVQALRANGDAAGAVTPALQTALANLNPTAALEAILNDDSGIYNAREKLVAANILERRVALPTMRMVDSLGVDANGDIILGQYNSITDEISLVRGAEDSHTFMHEMIHAFVHRTIITQEREGARKQEFKELQDVYNYVKEKRPDLAKTYAMSSLTEFASEAMSNRDFQMQLMGIPYQKQSVFVRFARALRDLMGLDDAGAEGNTLFIAMISVDGLMHGGRELQVDTVGYRTGQITYGADTDNIPNVTQYVQNLTTPIGKPTPRTLADVNAAPDPVIRSELRKYMNIVTQSEAPLADVIRQQLVDQMAPIASKLSAAFSQGVRSSFGDINPMVWMRQAYDHARIALQVFRVGGLRMNDDGLWEAFQLKDNDGNNVSPTEIISKLKTLAEKQGLSYAATKARVGTVLEGMRLKDLREHNARIEALAVALANTGDVEGAFEKRQEKFALHKTFAEIDADVEVFENTPEVQEIQKMMNTVREGMIDAMVKSGRLSAEKAQTWKDAANYVPFDRLQNIMENPEIVFAQGRRGIAALARLPELRGSFERPVTNTVDNYMKKIAWMTEQTMRTSAVTRTLEYMEKAGMARQIRSVSEANNNHLVLPPQYKDGKVVLYEVQNQYDLAAFVQTPEVTGTMVNALGGASRLLRTTITATPMFSIKQVIDDSQRVMFNSGLERPLAGLGRTLYYFPRVWWSQAFGKDFRYMRQLERLGITGEIDYNPINPLSTLELDAGAVERGPVKALLYRMEQIAKSSDMAARLAVYEQTMQEKNDPLLAQTRARELINFNRRGASKTMRVLTHVVPFFNSYAQGNDLLYRGFTGADAPSGMGAAAARKMFISRVATMAALSTIYAMAMSEDDYYKELDDTVRDRNWILPKSFSDALGVEQPFKISVPNEFGFLFKSILERVVQYMRDDARGEAKDAGKLFRETIADIAGEYGMMPIPAAIKPILENFTNFSSFTRRELVSPSMQARPSALQYTSSTSELAKAFGKALDVSPIVVDNYIRGYFGMAGGAVSVVADGLMNPSRPDRGMEQIPFLSIGLVAPVGTRAKNQFYEFREDITKAVSGANLLKDNPAAFEAFYKKNQHLINAAPIMNQRLRALKTLRAQRKAFETDPAMSGEAKREALLELQRVENEVIADMKKFEAEIRRMK